MRSSNSSRTPATDFVQDYAAKRQAQMDRARQLREERLQQQQQQQQPSPSSGVGGDTGSNVSSTAPALTSPTGVPGSASTRPPPHVPRSRHPSAGQAHPPVDDAADRHVLYVKETDFKQATQAGIITPDQARQLWAMLSNQIIRVCPPSAQNNNAVSVSSLMALSNNSSASSNAGRNSGSGTNNNNSGFGASISLESLRTSIAYFKREQQRLQQQQQQPGGAAGGRPVSSPKTSNTLAAGGGGGASQQQQQQQQQRRAYPDDDVDEEEDVEDRYEEEENWRGGGGGGRGQDSRPAWNSDVDVNYGNDPAAARKKARTGATAKTSAVRPAASNAKANPSVASSSSARASQHTGGGGASAGRPSSSSRAYEEENSEVAYASPPPPRQPVASSSSANPRGGAAAAGGGGRRPPAGRAPAAPRGGTAPPVNLDDIPVGGGGGAGMSDWANAYPPGMAPPDSRGSGGGGFSAPVAPENDAIAAEAAAAAREPTEECATCGRSFRVSVLARHEALCRKQSNKPRKVFNMRDQRLDGVEGIEAVQRAAPRNAGGRGGGGGGGGGGAAAAAAKGKLPKWKVQHEQFQAAMKAVRNQGDGGGRFGSGALAPPPARLPDEYDDRVPCPHCGRKFAEDVAARHIPKCATTLAKPRGIRPIRR